jgi:hypothetical protein
MAADSCNSNSPLDTANARSRPTSHAIASIGTSSPSQSPSRSTSSSSIGGQQQDGGAQGTGGESVDAATTIPTPSQLLQGKSSLPELPLDETLDQALQNVTGWRSYTSRDLTRLPQRTCGTSSDTIAFNHGL